MMLCMKLVPAITVNGYISLYDMFGVAVTMAMCMQCMQIVIWIWHTVKLSRPENAPNQKQSLVMVLC